MGRHIGRQNMGIDVKGFLHIYIGITQNFTNFQIFCLRSMKVQAIPRVGIMNLTPEVSDLIVPK